MNNKKYTQLVENGNYPNDPLVPLDSPFIDDRGIIQNILNAPINGAAIITSKKGSIRSNHYHKTDFHYLYIIDGKLEYHEKYLHDHLEASYKNCIYKSGDLIFTAPLMVHKVVFLEDTTMISFSKRNRDHDSHEEDVVRMEF